MLNIINVDDLESRSMVQNYKSFSLLSCDIIILLKWPLQTQIHTPPFCTF